jgi:hypothetical protein
VAIRQAGPDDEGTVYYVHPESTQEELRFVRTNTRHLAAQREDSDALGQLWKETFTNVGFFYRDADLADEVLEKYQQGMIIQERAYVDCSYLEGGLTARHRYVIITGKARDLQALAGVDPSTVALPKARTETGWPMPDKERAATSEDEQTRADARSRRSHRRQSMHNEYEDKPRSLKDEKTREERRKLLQTEPCVQDLRKFVEEMREEKQGFDIPDFDPVDGGVKAQCLFLRSGRGQDDRRWQD